MVSHMLLHVVCPCFKFIIIHACLPACSAPQVLTSNAFMVGFLGVLAACTYALGIPAMFNLYFVPYWMFVVWLDVVTYLHHHGSSNPAEKMPWSRGEVRRQRM